MAPPPKEEPKSPIEKAGFKEEIAEEYVIGAYGAYVKTGFPQPYRRYRLVYESQQASIEHTYFWVYNHAMQDFGFGDVIKTLDTFSASENSSFWGLTEQRKGIQQDKASQFMAVIGRMTKELFQIVREIRILKERLRLYDGSNKGRAADDIALKGLWVDFAQSGGRQQGGMNIYTMAQQLGFSTLPDLFFRTYVKEGDDVAKVVDKECKEFNEKVREVLKRTLASYLSWKVETEKELRVRDRFTIKYLRQHWAAIRMYISWVKPYLRNVQKLSNPINDQDPELISSFEGALMEIEFLARRAVSGDKPTPTLLVTFHYRVKPQLQFQTEYQRGAVHVGRVEFTVRAYGWSDSQVKKYLAYREQETLELIGMVDTSLKDALDALGDELLDYLKEAGEDEKTLEGLRLKKTEEPKTQKPQGPGMLEPFTALFGGFKDLALLPFEGLRASAGGKDDAPQSIGFGDERAAKDASGAGFNVFKNYKKAHGMPAW